MGPFRSREPLQQMTGGICWLKPAFRQSGRASNGSFPFATACRAEKRSKLSCGSCTSLAGFPGWKSPTTTYLTIAEVEARNKNRDPWRQVDPSRPARDGGALLHLRAQPALRPKKDFQPCAGNPRRHPAVHCATRVL